MALLDLLKFVTAGGWGAGKGAPLTAAEHDGNTQNLADAIQDLIDNPVSGVSVSNISVVGRQVTFYMTDASTYGPFDLPVAQPRYRGEWEASASYSAFDIVTVTGTGVFMVLQDHTSEATFDEDASNSDGAYYVKIGAVVEGGGGGPAAPSEVVTFSGTNLTLSEAHVGKHLRFMNAAGCEVTVPDSIFEDDVEFYIWQGAVGDPVSIVEGSTGVGFAYREGKVADTAGFGSHITIKHVGGDLFDIWGDLADAP